MLFNHDFVLLNKLNLTLHTMASTNRHLQVNRIFSLEIFLILGSLSLSLWLAEKDAEFFVMDPIWEPQVSSFE